MTTAQATPNTAGANGIQTRGGKRSAHPLDFWRLCDKARDKGIKLHRGPDAGTFIASSASRPELTHYVDVEIGCTCEGYAGYSRCMHYAAALSALGWLPDWAEDDGPAPAGPAAAGPTAADYEAAAAHHAAEYKRLIGQGNAHAASWAQARYYEAAAAAQYAEWAARAEKPLEFQRAPWEEGQAITAAEQAHDDERERRSRAAQKGAETRRRNRERAAAAAAEAERRTGVPVRTRAQAA